MTKTTFEFPEYDPFKRMREINERLARLFEPPPVFKQLGRISRMFEPSAALKQMAELGRTLEGLNRPVVAQLQISQFNASTQVFERLEKISSMTEAATRPPVLFENYLTALNASTLRLAQTVAAAADESGRDLSNNADFETVTVLLTERDKNTLTASDWLAILLFVITLLVTISLSHGTDENIARLETDLLETHPAVSQIQNVQQRASRNDAELHQEVERLTVEVELLTKEIKAHASPEDDEAPRAEGYEAPGVSQ